MEPGPKRVSNVRRGAGSREVFQLLPLRVISGGAYSSSPARWFTMNRFDREYWDGAREMALMFYESLRGRNDVPDDLKQLAETALRETGERKNRDFREALGVVATAPQTGPTR